MTESKTYLPTQTYDWLRSLDHKQLISELRTASDVRRRARLKLARAVRRRVQLELVQSEDPAAKLKLEQLNCQIAELESAKIESDDHLEYLRSILRQSRAISKGLDYEVVKVLDFACSNPLAKPTKTAQQLIRRCIFDLMRYGAKLSVIEKAKRPPGAKKPSSLVELMSLPDVQRLNDSCDVSSFRAAYRTVRNESFGFSSVLIRPPRFISYTLDIKSGNEPAKRIIEFLQICARVDPRHWARCPKCRDYFLRRRANGRTQFCSDECRYDYHNQRDARVEQKAVACEEYKKGGGKYRG
jgi:hypothetical protein